jgi:transposase InsO family protein
MRCDEEFGVKVRASFLASDRTYGARRVWRDLLTEGVSCGLHRIERLMRLQALKALRDGVACRPIWVAGRSSQNNAVERPGPADIASVACATIVCYLRPSDASR